MKSRGIFTNLYKKIYIARKSDIEYDDYNNQIVTYDTPFYLGKFNYQPIVEGKELYAYMREHGETKGRLIKLFLDAKYDGMFKEFDLAYLYGANPNNEEIDGENANFKVTVFAPQNTVILVIFEEIIKEEN